MKYLKKSLDNAFSILGGVFIIYILLSFALNKPEILVDTRVYSLFFFFVLVVEKYFIFKRKDN